MQSRFSILQTDSSDEESETENGDLSINKGLKVSLYEDLSSVRNDEETVLAAVYTGDFSCTKGPWGSSIFCIHVRPPDIEKKKIGSELTLSLQRCKRYPYAAPVIELKNVKGLSKDEVEELGNLLRNRSRSLAKTGSVMGIELVQVVENYLLTHNKDPALKNMSAWEQMKVREEQERQMAFKRENTLAQLLRSTNNQTPISDIHDSFQSNHDLMNDEDIRKEVARKMEALNLAEEGEKSGLENGICADDKFKDTNGAEEDSNDEDFENDQYTFDSGNPSISRYMNDFIEKGLLGRGGGGEVVKVRNRLDRRIYAIKKIVLESEREKFAKIGKILNSKLRREVTTISSLAHKNIVRYYQAWVEFKEIDESTMNGKESKASEYANQLEISEQIDDYSDPDDSSMEGLWKESRVINSIDQPSKDENENDKLCSKYTSTGSQTSSAGTYLSYWSNESCQKDVTNVENFSEPSSSKSTSETSLLREIGDIQSPLLNGFASKDDRYNNILKGRGKNSILSPSHQKYQDSLSISGEGISARAVEDRNSKILYIQMEYCKTTLRHLIDENSISKMAEIEKWRLVRQIIEGLAYVHDRKVIHRDLKPGNIFLDNENNIRIGDFGLATTRQSKEIERNDDEDFESETEATKLYNAIDNINSLLGQSFKSKFTDKSYETMTGGIGTAFYCAPEQAIHDASKKKFKDYGTKADIFSLGVIIFEIFHPPFSTQMQRAESLERLRGVLSKTTSTHTQLPEKLEEFRTRDLDEEFSLRFPKDFEAPASCKRLILWCLQESPLDRPSAKSLLSTDLIPHKIELEQQFLEEAMQSISNPQSEISRMKILETLFKRSMPQHVEITFDTDSSTKMTYHSGSTPRRNGYRSPHEKLMKALHDLGGTNWEDLTSVHSLPMNALSLLAATRTLRRAKGSIENNRSSKDTDSHRGVYRCVATVFAMSAAASAATTGSSSVLAWLHPRLVSDICGKLTSVFEMHGAINLKPPLLRPRNLPPNTNAAEVMNDSGVVLLLPEDLTANFARSVGRGGAALSSIKRFDIDKVYHKSVTGGHPTETLEASFDIIQDEALSVGCYFEAETVLVVSQILLKTLSSRPWYIKFTHTRLADAILDVCGVSSKEESRQTCYKILSFCSSNVAKEIETHLSRQATNRNKMQVDRQQNSSNNNSTKSLDEFLNCAINRKELSDASANRLRTIFSIHHLPLCRNIFDALRTLREGVIRLRTSDIQKKISPRILKRYEDIDRSINSLHGLFDALDSLGLCPPFQQSDKIRQSEQYNQQNPCFLSLDLGLRHTSKQFHGQLYYQVIILEGNCAKSFASGYGLKHNLDCKNTDNIIVAEGGRYDDLVRKFRPPGNLASFNFNEYTTAQIPLCVGVRLFLDKICLCTYVDSYLPYQTGQPQKSLLGYPIPSQHAIRCIVTSVNGMDPHTLSERAIVAAHLWREGISAEYISQSGVMINLLRNQEKDNLSSNARSWTLEQLCGICGQIKIPFIVIVQPHLLKEKNSVRLRCLLLDSSNNLLPPGWSEEFVQLDSLVSTINDHLINKSTPNKEFLEENNQESDKSERPLLEISQLRKQKGFFPTDCVYIEEEQYYFDIQKKAIKDSKTYKTLLKKMKMMKHRAEAFVGDLKDSLNGRGSQSSLVLALDIPFRVIRDFGTTVMTSSQSSLSSCAYEAGQKYPKYKKVLKTLSAAIESLLKRSGPCADNDACKKINNTTKSSLIPLFLYSIQDDQFDLLSLRQKLSDNQFNSVKGKK